ncbi:MAG: hypothetical protein ABR946_01280 [Solirubrobacteraceae bacterium]
MTRVEALGRFVWDFVVGDDWRVAVGVAVAIGATALVSTTKVAAWWVLPGAVAGLLALTLWRATRAR